MNRRRLAVVSGLIVSSSFAAVAWSQAPTRQPTLAERMAALRRGWTGGSQQQATNDSSRAAATSPSTQNGVPQIDGRSLIPGNAPGRGVSQQPTARVPAPSGPNSAPRIASRPRAGSVQANESFEDGFTLPGLGGSRLPSDASSQPQLDRTATGNTSRNASSDYPVIQPQIQSNRAISTRYGSSAAPSTQSSQPSVRRSPQRRTALNVDPHDLSRELIGSFPTASESNPQSIPPTPTEESADYELQPTPANTPLSLPVTNERTNDNSASSNSVSTPQLKIIESADEKAHRGSDAAMSPSTDLHSAFGRGTSTGTHRPNTSPLVPPSARNRDPFGESNANASADPTVLVTQQTPIITTDIRGPRQILVGREATYRVRLENQGSVAAESIVASIRIPAWADVIDTTTSHGTIQQSQNGGTTGLLEWQIVRLEGRSSETLDVRLVPRSSRPLELGVSYTVAPVGSRAVVEVQEPKLDIRVTGPDEVLYGKPQLFRLTITNPGTGTAENVKIDLLPPGGGEAAVSSHPLGDLAAGTNKTVEMELTAREAGKLSVKAHAVAEGGLAADADKEIFCRKPELEVDWRGPEQKYAGTQATYFFRVRNPGTAPAEDVTVRVSLPDGAEYAGASEGQSLDAKRREVSWHVGTLGPGDDYYMELKCLMQSPGANQLKISAATAAGELADSKLAETSVVALADLKLEVSDPNGPVAVGDEAIYEIRVKNRGASAAKDVNIIALFSDGVEPDQVEGALYTVADGRVSFRTVEELPAGRQIALRIRAHAVQPGMHVFRAEVLCKDLEIKLAAEESTRFYADDLPAEGGPEQQSAERSQQFEQSTVR